MSACLYDCTSSYDLCTTSVQPLSHSHQFSRRSQRSTVQRTWHSCSSVSVSSVSSSDSGSSTSGDGRRSHRLNLHRLRRHRHHHRRLLHAVTPTATAATINAAALAAATLPSALQPLSSPPLLSPPLPPPSPSPPSPPGRPHRGTATTTTGKAMNEPLNLSPTARGACCGLGKGPAPGAAIAQHVHDAWEWFVTSPRSPRALWPCAVTVAERAPLISVRDPKCKSL